MPAFRKLYLVGTVVALPFVAAVILWASRGGSPAARREEVFEQAWEIIGTKYYDRDMNGLDWQAVHDHFKPRLRDMHNDFDLYSKLLKPMAELLENSHVQLDMPPRRQPDDKPRAEAADATSVRACDGLWSSMGRQYLMPHIRNVDSSSALYAAGVRRHWRLAGRLENPDRSSGQLIGVFVTTSGKQVQIPLVPGAQGNSVAANLVQQDFLSLQALVRSGADPSTELKMNSLGISVTIGQAAKPPSVVDVEPGSQAASAGIEPGSEFKTWNDKQGSADERIFSATLVSPDGREYEANYTYQMPCVPRGAEVDLVSRQLPGNVLYLRFNHFEPEVVPWLDEQLQVMPRAVILDLRYNIGGNVEVMLETLSRFFDPGTRAASVVQQAETAYWTTMESPVNYKGTLAVLVGPLSASAAEVSASAFRFQGRATLYGQATSGKVQLSRQFPLPDGGMVQVAIADVRGPGDQRLEAAGVAADRVVLPTLESVRAGRDAVLDAALADLAPSN